MQHLAAAPNFGFVPHDFRQHLADRGDLDVAGVEDGRLLRVERGDFALQPLLLLVERAQPHGQVAQVGRVAPVQFKHVEELGLALLRFDELARQHRHSLPALRGPSTALGIQLDGKFGKHVWREDAVDDGVHQPRIDDIGATTLRSALAGLPPGRAVVVRVSLRSTLRGLDLHRPTALAAAQKPREQMRARR